MTTCNRCERQLGEDDIRWFDNYPYCEDCFNENYTYCVSCDEPVDRDYVRYNSNDEPMCDECYSEDYDYDAPDNPYIDNEQRDEIITLAKDWLNGKRPKRLIKINPNDFSLAEIQSGVGLVEHALYVYGLQDREEYQLKVSSNLFNRVSQYTTLNNWDIKIATDIGTNRIGISRTFRETKLDEIINLLKNLTTTQKEIAA